MARNARTNPFGISPNDFLFNEKLKDAVSSTVPGYLGCTVKKALRYLKQWNRHEAEYEASKMKFFAIVTEEYIDGMFVTRSNLVIKATDADKAVEEINNITQHWDEGHGVVGDVMGPFDTKEQAKKADYRDQADKPVIVVSQ